MLPVIIYYHNFILNFRQKKMLMLFNLSDHNSIANQFVSELRDKNVQTDRARFRRNMRKLGQIMAYEISKRLKYKPKSVETPLGTSVVMIPENNPVLLTVLRAGLPYFEGFLDYFDQSDCGFVGAYRDESTDEIVIHMDYIATPPITEREVILIDPMLATGKSVVNGINKVLKSGRPSHIHIAALVAAPEGIKYTEEHVTTPHSLYTCAVDEKLNELFYIVPGLGDAGDLSFGPKI
jgi:uracil phosphoribosyltransferase